MLCTDILPALFRSHPGPLPFEQVPSLLTASAHWGIAVI